MKLLIVLIVLASLIILGIIIAVILRHKASAEDTSPIQCSSGQINCQNKCYDSKMFKCSPSGEPLEKCGANYCIAGEECNHKNNTCKLICTESKALCSPDNSKTFCLLEGEMNQPFSLYFGQRLYSANHKYYAMINEGSNGAVLSVYNNSDAFLNWILSGQLPAGKTLQRHSSFVTFDNDGITLFCNNESIASLKATSVANATFLCFIHQGQVVLNSSIYGDPDLDAFYKWNKSTSPDLVVNTTWNSLTFIKDGVVSLISDTATTTNPAIPIVDNTTIPAAIHMSLGKDNITILNLYALDKSPIKQQLNQNVFYGSTGYPLYLEENTLRLSYYNASSLTSTSYADQIVYLGSRNLIDNYNNLIRLKVPNPFLEIILDYLIYYYLRTNKVTNYGEYPYLLDDDIRSEIPLKTGTSFYAKLVASWCRHYNTTFISQPIADRFGLSSSTSSVDIKKSRDYNINTSIGRAFCATSAESKQFCSSIIKDLCYDSIAQYSQQITGDQDALKILKVDNLHPECDTCRVLYMNPGELAQQIKPEIINKFLRPYCQSLSSKFVDMNYRTCCKNNNTDECTQINSLFTKNGNCSCFMGGGDLETLFDAANITKKAAIGLSPDCYSDCVQNDSYYHGAYDANNCKSDICIIDQKDIFNIDNADIGSITDKDVASCRVGHLSVTS